MCLSPGVCCRLAERCWCWVDMIGTAPSFGRRNDTLGSGVAESVKFASGLVRPEGYGAGDWLVNNPNLLSLGLSRCSGASDARQGLTGVPDKCRVVGRLLKGGRAGPDVTIVK